MTEKDIHEMAWLIVVTKIEEQTEPITIFEEIEAECEIELSDKEIDAVSKCERELSIAILNLIHDNRETMKENNND